MPLTLPGPLVLAGGGNMGSALLDRWQAQDLNAPTLTVVEPHAPTAEALRTTHPHLTVVPSPEGLAPAAVVVLAVKPQVMPTVLPAYAGQAAAGALMLSVAAGRSLSFLADHLGAGARVVRAMPNTPARLGLGMTVLCAAPPVDAGGRALAEALLAAVGAVAWLEDESLMHAVTGVSGSGPAYVFLLAEALAEAGVAQGLPADLAGRLARETVRGAGALLGGADEDPATLRRQVTSPGGVTEAALSVLMREEDGLPTRLREALAAAVARSRALDG